MMNFYEEFGVRNDAPVEEIRQAYKTLARVLHPDGQTDEKLRAAAVCQMKRLHEIVGILMDPQKRRAYDESLSAVYSAPVYQWAPPSQPFVDLRDKFDLAQSVLRHWFWILIAAVIFGSGFWYLTARVPTLAEFAPGQPSVAAQPDETGPSPQPAGLSAGLPAGTGGTAPPEKVRSAVQPPPSGFQQAPDATASLFAGDWLYTSAAMHSVRQRAPLFIDFRLVEKNGMLNGDYRARYEVPRQPASQSVMLQVRGKSPAGASATLAWTSDDGAGGEMDLFLDTPDSLQVTWWTTKLGRRTDLSSDAATLRRH
jgi:curved DNA-binding protein CbpA